MADTELLMKDEEERAKLTESFPKELMRFQLTEPVEYIGAGGHTYREAGWAKQRIEGRMRNLHCGGAGAAHDCHCDSSSSYDGYNSSKLKRSSGSNDCGYGLHSVSAIGPGGHTYSSSRSYVAGGHMCFVAKKVCGPDCSCRLVVTDAFFKRDCAPPRPCEAEDMGGKLLGNVSFRYGTRTFDDYDDMPTFRLTPASYNGSGSDADIGGDYEGWRAQTLSSDAARELLS